MDTKKFGHDVVNAIANILAKHGHPDAQVTIGGLGKNIVVGIKLDGATAGANGLTSNAIARYKANMHALGLPAIGTKFELPGKDPMTLRGLSSDLKRVKVEMGGKPGVKNMPLGLILSIVAVSGNNELAKLDEQEQAAGDNVDPDVTAFLAALGKKAAE